MVLALRTIRGVILARERSQPISTLPPVHSCAMCGGMLDLFASRFAYSQSLQEYSRRP